MFQFKCTKNELHHKYFPKFCIDKKLRFSICRNFKNGYFTELLATGFYWLPGFSNKMKATRYSITEGCSIVNKNIVKSKVKFKTNGASMNDYNYGKLRISLKVVSMQACQKKLCNTSVCDKLYQCLVCFVPLKIQQKKHIQID